MNWDAIGAVAEIAGVLAVVVSLLYLARQVKTGNDLNRNNTFREIMQGLVTHFNVMFGPENAELMAKGFKGYESLTPVERLRFAHLLASLFQYAEDSWNSAQVDLLRDETMVSWRWYFRTQFFTYPGAQEWWAHFKQGYAPDFRSWVDSVAQSAEPSDDPYGIIEPN